MDEVLVFFVVLVDFCSAGVATLLLPPPPSSPSGRERLVVPPVLDFFGAKKEVIIVNCDRVVERIETLETATL